MEMQDRIIYRVWFNFLPSSLSPERCYIKSAYIENRPIQKFDPQLTRTPRNLECTQSLFNMSLIKPGKTKNIY